MTALTRALQIDVNVAYLDGRGGIDGRVDFVEFKSGGDKGTVPLILLYRCVYFGLLLLSFLMHTSAGRGTMTSCLDQMIRI